LRDADAKSHFEFSNSLKRLVFIGRLSAEKAPDLFINLCREFKVPAVVIGGGILSKNLLEKIRLENLDVKLLGQLVNPWEEFTIGDLLVVPSRTEGDGLVVLEALSLGIPLLLSDILAFRSFQLPEHHYCKDTVAFFNRLETFKHDLQSLVVSDQIADRILKTRRPEIIGTEWEIFLKSDS
jgi:glycosyltransferase involved in cell wall biosynthesis